MPKIIYSNLEENDTNAMYHAIWQFKEAYKRCFMPYPLFYNGVVKVLFVPGVVNLAFALELEMKYLSLIYKGRYICNKHDLDLLFYDLPNNILKDSYFREKEYVKENLESASKVFTEARYDFQEGNSYGLEHKNFIEAVEIKMFEFVEKSRI